MGLIGLLVTVAIMILGAGYFLFGSGGGTMTVENPNAAEVSVADTATGAGAVAQYQTVKDTALDASKQITENSQQLADSIDQITESSQPKIENKQEADKTTVAPPAVRQPAEIAPQIKIIEKKIDFGFSVPKEKRSIDTVVLHSSYNSTGGDPYSVEKVIDIWRGYGVAPHYMIDRKGNIYQLVDDADIAYHAGVSKMPDGRTNVNDFSIGIEILNTKDGAYTDAEYASVNALIASLRSKYGIKTVVGHADIAPGRKDDPWKFDWKKIK